MLQRNKKMESTSSFTDNAQGTGRQRQGQVSLLLIAGVSSRRKIPFCCRGIILYAMQILAQCPGASLKYQSEAYQACTEFEIELKEGDA